MSKSPVTLAVPQRFIGIIDSYCTVQHKKKSEFFEETLREYTDDKLKIAQAVFNRIASGKDGFGEVKYTPQRVDPAPCNALRDLAHSTALGFDSLTRIIIEDKLEHLGLLH